MEYDFKRIEKYWQEKWRTNKAYKISNPVDGQIVKPKYYVLDMFPYPSGTGLHVGHPLGYIASDIYSRYKRLKGYNVLHPMGFDSFGLPAEQYALDTGQHPAETTKKNIETFKSQLDNIGTSYDWDREVRTSDPQYYKWTQWIFLQLFNSYYDRKEQKAKRIGELINIFEQEGSVAGQLPGGEIFTAKEWATFSKKEKSDILMNCRLAYCGYGEVNWCEALGTVLANDEVVNGVSERGGYPVIKKKLRQWYLRITAYADRLLLGMEKLDWSEAMKEMQTNWIGKSSGAEISFAIKKAPSGDEQNAPIISGELTRQAADGTNNDSLLRVYTTRPDTIFGVDFMVIAAEHELVETITTAEQKTAVADYIDFVKSRSERERIAEKKISGVFTGSYALNPFDGKEIPIWISEYVLAGYGTGAIMAVPCGDERDFKFAKNFGIPVTNIIGAHFNGEEANSTKEAVLENSGFLNGLVMKTAMEVAIKAIEEKKIGLRKVNYKMRDAAFSRQRYWGEPFPIEWIDGIPYPLAESELPLVLPPVNKYGPGPDGEGPLANLTEWVHQQVKIAKEPGYPVIPDDADLAKAGVLETNTMPGYAGSSWYFLRYMDPGNHHTFCDRRISDYWNQVDIYIGGTEHAVGHLLYSRLWTKVLFDLGYIGFDEPFKKLMNQGMIQGSSRFVYRLEPLIKSDKPLPPLFISYGLYEKWKTGELTSMQILSKANEVIPGFWYGEDSLNIELAISPIHVDVNIVDGTELDMRAFRKWRAVYNDAEFLLEEGKYFCGVEVEKMSKAKFNTVNPDILVSKYGADTFRMYEMFLGPVEMSKPWDTKGIEGVHRFLKKLWRLFFDDIKGKIWTSEKATDAELKVLHKTIRKIEEDTERFSFNTGVSTFMIAVNELTELKCHKKEILETLVVLLTPYAPHIAEELYAELQSVDANNQSAEATPSVLDASFPLFESKYVIESSKEYPISINGKMRTTMDISLSASQTEVESLVLNNDIVLKWMEGKAAKKIIFVKGKMVNVVV